MKCPFLFIYPHDSFGLAETIKPNRYVQDISLNESKHLKGHLGNVFAYSCPTPLPGQLWPPLGNVFAYSCLLLNSWESPKMYPSKLYSGPTIQSRPAARRAAQGLVTEKSYLLKQKHLSSNAKSINFSEVSVSRHSQFSTPCPLREKCSLREVNYAANSSLPC